MNAYFGRKARLQGQPGELPVSAPKPPFQRGRRGSTSLSEASPQDAPSANYAATISGISDVGVKSWSAGAGTPVSTPGVKRSLESVALHPGDFAIREDGVVRLNSEMAKRIAAMAGRY
jgi:hypothetical protein